MNRPIAPRGLLAMFLVAPCLVAMQDPGAGATSTLQHGKATADGGPAPELIWLVGQQQEDGSWPSTPKVSQVRVTAMALLALVSEGPSSRGDDYCAFHANGAERAAKWLASTQDPKGRFGFDSGPSWIEGHALTAYALLEDARINQNGEFDLARVLAVANATSTLAQWLAADRTEKSPELLAAAALLSDSENLVVETIDARAGAAELQQLITANAALAAALRSVELPKVDAPSAALRFVGAWRGEASDSATAESTAALVDPVRDPMAALFGAIVMRCSGQRAELSQRLGAGVLATVPVRVAGHWGRFWPEPAAPEQLGPIGYHAMRFLMTTQYYRYCKLSADSVDQRMVAPRRASRTSTDGR